MHNPWLITNPLLCSTATDSSFGAQQSSDFGLKTVPQPAQS
jgi:hypothetical protein